MHNKNKVSNYLVNSNAHLTIVKPKQINNYKSNSGLNLFMHFPLLLQVHVVHLTSLKDFSSHTMPKYLLTAVLNTTSLQSKPLLVFVVPVKSFAIVVVVLVCTLVYEHRTLKVTNYY